MHAGGRRPAAVGDIHRDDIVASIAVEIAHRYLMPLYQSLEDDVALSLAALLGIDHDLVAMPGLLGREKALALDVDGINVVGALRHSARAGNVPRLIAFA